ncbi:hypothetical protein AZE42_04740, partial [Rhizopogon vesiculosus]
TITTNRRIAAPTTRQNPAFD